MKIINYVLLVLIILFSCNGEVFAQSALSISSLRSVSAPSAYPVFISDTGKEGFFYYDSADSSSLDNNATVIVTTNGKRFKRSFSGALNAKWFGLKEGGAGFDNAPIIASAINATLPGQELLIEAGIYYFNSPIILPANKRIRFTALGTLNFISGDGIVIHGSHNVYLTNVFNVSSGSDYKNYSLMNGSGILLDNSSYSNITVEKLGGFINGIFIRGSLGSGSQYNKIQFGILSYNKVGIYVSIDSASDGWANENTVTGGRIIGYTGLLMARGGPLQIGAFNGNKFYNIGFETLTNGIDIGFANENHIISPRFENVTNGINLRSDAGGNTITGTTLYESQFVHIAPGTIFLGRLLTSSGSPAGEISIADKNGKFVTVNEVANSRIVQESSSTIVSLTGVLPTRKSININGNYYSVEAGIGVIFMASTANAEVDLPNVANNVDREITVKNVGTGYIKVVPLDPNEATNVVAPASSFSLKSDGQFWRKI